ncbi:hypothetical protein JCM33374_g6631 [Metschnikowia sp. JCM 33374]|nr:hypothetical protein JCM33374_g6631 [Metschnikowia sp. JCM 33374]
MNIQPLKTTVYFNGLIGFNYNPELHFDAHSRSFEENQDVNSACVEKESTSTTEGNTPVARSTHPNSDNLVDICALGLLSPSTSAQDISENLSPQAIIRNSNPRSSDSEVYTALNDSPASSPNFVFHNHLSNPLHSNKSPDLTVSHPPPINPTLPSAPRYPQKIPKSQKGAARFYTSPRLENLSTSSSIQWEVSEDAQRGFAKLIPSLKAVSKDNFCVFLIKVLKQNHHHVPLDVFYHMLHSHGTMKDIRTLYGQVTGMSQPLSDETVKTIEVYHLVLESFKVPQTFQNGLLQNSMVSTVNFHELIRSFLAMKILYGCIKKVPDASQTLARISIYKVYYILCQRLIEKYPAISSAICIPESTILGQSKMGILFNLVYPDLVCKRLGKRGQSKTHYIGLAWNKTIVDDDTIGLSNLDITDLRRHFNSTSQPPKRQRLSRTQNSKTIHYEPSQATPKHSPLPMPLPDSTKPLYSFVDLSCKYPQSDCSPRAWTRTPNSVPEHSEWAKSILESSVQVLKGHGVNLDPVVANTRAGIFSGEDSCISNTVLQSIHILSDASSSKEIFLHLYLAIMVSLLPAILASDTEISAVSKSQLRAAIYDCVTNLEKEDATRSDVDKVSICIFTKLLRKMAHINEMSSISVKQCSALSVLKEMVNDTISQTNTVCAGGDLSVFEEMFIEGVIKALNAYDYGIADDNAADSRRVSFATMRDMGKYFTEVSLMVIRNMLQIADRGELSSDLPYQIFHIVVKHWHVDTRLYREISRLPIPIIIFSMTHHTHVLQNASFVEFAKRDSDVSQETFKSWWVYSSMYQEYMSVISEIISLSRILA